MKENLEVVYFYLVFIVTVGSQQETKFSKMTEVLRQGMKRIFFGCVTLGIAYNIT
jgi:hypothetical protein